jgi:hypothetical protein
VTDSKDDSVLGGRVASEAVQAKPELAAGVVLADKAEVGEENAKAEVIFVARVDLVGLSHPGDERPLLVAPHEPGGGDGEQNGDHHSVLKI